MFCFNPNHKRLLEKYKKDENRSLELMALAVEAWEKRAVEAEAVIKNLRTYYGPAGLKAVSKFIEENARLREDNRVLREELNWYAEIENDPGKLGNEIFNRTLGNKAKKALAKVSQGEKL